MATMIATSLVGLQIAITTLILGFTSRASALRSGGLLLVIYCAYLQIPHITHVQNPVARGFLANSTFVLTILYIDKALLSRWIFTIQGPTSSVSGLQPVDDDKIPNKRPKAHPGDEIANGLGSRLRFGLHLSMQSRFANTRWPVKNIPAFDKANPGYVPSKAEFLRAAIPKWALYVLILDLAGFLNSSSENGITFAAEQVPLFSRLGNISGEDVITRIASILAFWSFQYMVIEVVYGAIAIVAILSGLSAVEAWPPMFGSLSESYSLRQFWGCFYHQLVRRGCGSIAHAITYRSLRLNHGGFLGRYIFILLTFAVSGAFHTCSDVSQGVPLRESGAMSFFCIQTLGIMIEDGVQALCLSRVDKTWRRQRVHLLRRLIGYLWVAAWLVWTTPSWTYPMIRRDRGGRLLPFSVLAKVPQIQ
ncbi:MAG: hypothetical protein L6R42_004203 [Xanthoria sp. 1 TBL-2021]|nr:MAG: hypothetical protein L6R42_004203 [Xanthoria sp. 1 TBL-2021]